MWRVNKRSLASVFLAVGVVALPSSAAAQTVIQSKICNPFNAPTLTAPAPDTRTNSSSIHVAGNGTPSLAVTITKNGVNVGTVQTPSSGTYGLEIPLDPGVNTLDAMSTNECGTLKASATITVTRTSTAITLLTPATVTPITPSAPAPAASASPNTSNTSKSAPAATGSAKSTPASNNTLLQEQMILNSPAAVNGIPLPVATTLTSSQQKVVTKPKSGETVDNDRTWVSGIAAPLTNVSVYVNEVIAARVTSDDTGSYGALIQLEEGANKVYVLAKNSDGEVTLRRVDVRLVKSTTADDDSPATKASNTAASIVIAIFGIGGVCITASIWWHIWHVRRYGHGGPL